eukprot:89097_1
MAPKKPTKNTTKPVLQDIKLLLSRSWFLSLQQLCIQISLFMETFVISQITVTNAVTVVAGVNLSISFSWMFCTVLCQGLTIALGTLLPQSVAAGHKTLTIIYVQRAWYIVSILVLFLSIIQWFAGDIMVIMGQPEEFRDIINNYCRISILSTLIDVIFSVLNPLIQCLVLNKHLFYLNIISIILFIPLSYILMYYTNLGYLAVAVAFVIYNIFNVCSQIFILWQ